MVEPDPDASGLLQHRIEVVAQEFGHELLFGYVITGITQQRIRNHQVGLVLHDDGSGQPNEVGAGLDRLVVESNVGVERLEILATEPHRIDDAAKCLGHVAHVILGLDEGHTQGFHWLDAKEVPAEAKGQTELHGK